MKTARRNKIISEKDFFSEFPQLEMFFKVLDIVLTKVLDKDLKKYDNVLVLIYSPGEGKAFYRIDQIKDLSDSFEEEEASSNYLQKYVYIATNKNVKINEAILFIFLYAVELLEASKEITLIDFFSELEQNSSVFFVQTKQKMFSDASYSKELISTIDNIVDKITKTFFELNQSSY